MLDLVPAAGPLMPGSSRAWRGLWWWLTRRERSAPPAGPGAPPYAYTYGLSSEVPDGTPPPSTPPTVSELYHAHRLGMVRLAVLLVDDLATAEDVVQDAFTALYRRHGERITEVDNALGYLRTAVVNTSRSVLRRRRTARAWIPEATADIPSAEASVVLGEAQREVLAALGRLTPRRRQVLVLRYWADLSEAEIAETLGISRGSVKSNASRGLDALERILEGRV
ncbi:SigE family RNA polymerase sigma factor [Streptomyces sp. NBC_00249]|uniref:RNA polymerase sigma factor n=1 Tax=Streptomyces sp. NBC_00249 TaxID=2975690 RepID=UPI00224EFFB7|nr:SigE family RNA polymerase sigma factor [Streptomyces sp. NBC_00249]MCX5192786.1 SigE family RNA polymerase sigma factor [Streptomyces sp. NBC_00249]